MNGQIGNIPLHNEAGDNSSIFTAIQVYSDTFARAMVVFACMDLQLGIGRS